MIKGRDIIIHLAVKYAGDWNRIYEAIKAKEPVTSDEIEETLATVRSCTLTIIDDDYPEQLKRIYKPPFVLFYYGDKELMAEERRLLAVVGSRQPGSYGITMTKRIVAELAQAQLIIVSGLARGIDHLAHETAMANGSRTIAVLGSGIDRCYPEETRATYEQMKKTELILSEYPGMSEPHKDHFPWRNRIIAGLAAAVTVTEARKRSGTLITVGYALYLGKDVYVVPHPANVDNSGNQLIREGAVLVESGADILAEMKRPTDQPTPAQAPELPPKSFI